MINYFSSEFKLGILGGGQLGKMLLYETQKLDICTYVLDPNLDAPCNRSCDHFVQGDLSDFQTVYEFGKKVDVLTIEIEHVNCDALYKLESEGVKVYPSAKTLKQIQNKGKQKQFYLEHHIPTGRFQFLQNKNHLIESITNNKIQLPFVWKSTEGGYDGNGVVVIRTGKDVAKIPDVACIAEEYIDFQKELAVLIVRNPSGEVKNYPVVEMDFHPKANQVEYVICPARIPDAIAQKAIRVAHQVSHAFGHVGLLAIEMFLTHQNEILINEVAPRPHNSGHYSIEASYTNQFAQHIRAILDLPLGHTASKAGAVMVNLVGSAGYEGQVYYRNMKKILEMQGVTPHIYGKKITRPFRKMGHITVVHPDIDRAKTIAEFVKNTIAVETLKIEILNPEETQRKAQSDD